METPPKITDWEAMYQASDTPWDKGEPSPGLVDWLAAHSDLPRGTVLVPGCGMGHDVRAWATAGFVATGFDIAPSAVERAKVAGLPERTEFRLGDFLADEPHANYDWIFEHTCFCAIPLERREDYVRAVVRWLKPGGLLALIDLLPDALVDAGGAVAAPTQAGPVHQPGALPAALQAAGFTAVRAEATGRFFVLIRASA